MKKPDIFEYLDLRLYLVDFYRFRKTHESGFSYEKWTQEMGFRSRSYLRAVVVGKKPLHESLLLPLTKSLQLDGDGIDYLTVLLGYSIAPSPELKESYGRQLLQKWRAQIQRIEVPDISEFLSDSLIPVVFTYLSFEDASSDLALMAKHLHCEITRLQKALRCLVWQKLVEGSLDENGQVLYTTVSPFFKIPSLPNNLALRSFHREGLKQAEQAIEKPSAERKYYATFVAMDETQFLKFQELVQEFNDRMLSTFNSPELKEKKIYRVNTQVFPVST